MYPKKINDNYPKDFWENNDVFNDDVFDFVHAFIHRSYMIGMHSHDFYEINIVINGSGAHYVENQMFEIKKGDIFVIPPFVRHGYYQTSDLDVFHILISHLFFDRYLNELEQLQGYLVLFNLEPLIRMNVNESLFINLDESDFNQFNILLVQLLNICASEDIENSEKKIMKNAFTLYIIADLSRYCKQNFSLGDKAHIKQNYLIFMKSLEPIYTEYDKKITIDKLSKSISMSRSAYIKAFKKILNCTPGEFINNYRITKAKSLLIQTEISTTEIALQTGFYDSSHFIRSFERAEGITPRQYRKENHSFRKNL